MTNCGKLTARDIRILSLLLDPEALPTAPTPNINNETPTSSFQTDELEHIRFLEKKAIEMAEYGSVQNAENLLSQTIMQFPNGPPSLWTNRAQARRLLGNIDGALDDLGQAILVAGPSDVGPISSVNAKILSDAYIHRATIFLLLAKGNIVSAMVNEDCSESLMERASQDFSMAGGYGNELGRMMAVRTNPYAKLCGAIVETALRKEMQPIV